MVDKEKWKILIQYPKPGAMHNVILFAVRPLVPENTDKHLYR